MFNLTKQERLVLVFLAVVFLIGTTLHYVFKKSARLQEMISLIDNDGLYHKMDINQATYEELLNLPSVGPVTAKRIIDYRRNNGPLTHLEELKAIEGIGNSNYQKIVKFLRIPPETLNKN